LFSFVALSTVNGQCNTNAITTAGSNFVSCETNALTANSPANVASALCTCASNYVTDSASGSSGCDAVTLAVDGYCSAFTIISEVQDSNYNFGSCSVCANPPSSPNFPPSCSNCIQSYTSCLTTGLFSLEVAPSVALSFSLVQACQCLSSYFSCFAGCNSPLSSYVNTDCNLYSFCGCNGNGAGVVDVTAAITYLKSTNFVQFQYSITTSSGGVVVDIDCETPTANTPGLANDRILCDITFNGTITVNWTQVHIWITSFVGTKVHIGDTVILTGEVSEAWISPKRDVDTELSNTYTIQAVSASSTGVTLIALVLALCVVFM